AFDSDHPEAGPVFSIPVTVLKPIEIDHTAQVFYQNLCFKPTELKRWYIQVPTGATKMVVTVSSKNLNASAPANFIINCCQLLPQERFSAHEYQKYFMIAQGSYESGTDSVQKVEHLVDVVGGVTIEVVLGQFWSQFDSHEIDVKMEFNGLQILESEGCSSSIFIDGNIPSNRICLKSDLRRTDNITPSISLTNVRKPLQPASAEIKSFCSKRDLLPNKLPIYGLYLTYKVSLDKGKVVFRFPACDNFIYDSWFEDKMIQIYNSNKKNIGVFSVYPSTVTIGQKGDYIIRVLVRHSDLSQLEKIKNSTLYVDMEITSISPVISGTFATAFVLPQVAIKNASIDKGKMMNIWISSIKRDGLQFELNSGDLLMGKLDFKNKKLFSPLIKMLAPIPAPKSPEKDKSTSKSTEKADSLEVKVSEATQSEISGLSENDPELTEFNKAIFELKLTWISKIKAKESREKLISELMESDPSNIDLYLSLFDFYNSEIGKGFFFLNNSEKVPKLSDLSELSKKIYELVDKAIEIINPQELAYSIRNAPKTQASKAELDTYSKLEKSKSNYLKVLMHKCRAMLYLYFINALFTQKQEFVLYNEGYIEEVSSLDISSLPMVTLEDIEGVITEYRNWAKNGPKEEIDLCKDQGLLNANMAVGLLAKNCGTALAEINKYLSNLVLNEENSQAYKDAWNTRIKLLYALGWDLWAQHFESNMYFDFPCEYSWF
ncbi:hypothetical protein BB560_005799, partial [Smittium megazygosporum]